MSDQRSAYRFALRPRWIVLHILLVIVVALFGLAGFWQLDRLAERRDHNALVARRSRMPEQVLRRFLDSPGEATYRHIVARGRYDIGREIVLRSRGNEEQPGNHVLTPLVMDGGRAVIVDRGWVPARFESPPVVDALPPDGELVVSGIVLPSEGSGPFTPSPKRERLEAIARIDIGRIGRALPYETFPSYLVLREQDPRQRGDYPVPASSRLVLEEGPHLIYAIQWFLFIAIALIGYRAILRREARKPATSAPSEPRETGRIA